MIAIALACAPRLLMADEPTTGLDVTVQAQILDLLGQLQRDRDMAMILVTHDLGVVATRTDEIIVMYAGNVVERAPTNVLFKSMAMPYTEALLKSTPRIAEPSHTRLIAIEGRPPDLLNPPVGLPLLAPLPLRPGQVPPGEAAAGRGGPGPQLRLLVPADDAVDPRPAPPPARPGAGMTDTTVDAARGGDRPAALGRGPPRLLRPGQRDRAGRRRHHLHPAPGRDARPRRRVGLRQVDDRPRHRPGREGHLGQDPLRRHRADGAQPRRPAHAAHAGADDLPGPDLLAEPAAHGSSTSWPSR